MYLIGVDEAGRGPVIGPMVMVGLLIRKSDESFLRDLGVKDSKLLSTQRREELFPLLSKFDHVIEIIPPREIDQHVKSKDSNLNLLELNHTAKIINNFLKRYDDITAFVDCPSTNTASYKELLMSKLIKPINLVVEHGADKNYLVVGAASIIAKVVRDKIINDLKKEIGIDFGSGYPSDPLTKKFLEQNFDKFDFFRKSWSSYEKLVDNEKNKSLKDFF